MFQKFLIGIIVITAQLVAGQEKVLIMQGDIYDYEAFNCVTNASETASFEVCKFDLEFYTSISPPSCSEPYNNYDLIMLHCPRSYMNVEFTQRIKEYLSQGGSFFYQPVGGDLRIETQDGVNNILTHISQDSIIMDCSNTSFESDTLYFSGPLAEECVLQVNGINTGYGCSLKTEGLEGVTIATSAIGPVLAFWPTGFGGVFGLGVNFFPSGNQDIFISNIPCNVNLGPAIWSLIDPIDPECFYCDEPEVPCDDFDCLNGVEYWDHQECICKEGELSEDPGCDDGICTNGLESWNGCECVTKELIQGCTESLADNYNPLAECDDGTCVYENYLSIPNVINPSLQGLNSTLVIQSNNVVDFDWRIFDRWGNLVFSSSNPDQTWDGKYEGSTLASGVYVYFAEVSYRNGQEEQKKGSITIVY